MQETQFDGVAYLKKIANENKKAKDDGYFITECSGVQGIQGLMENYRKVGKFILVDDLVPGRVTMNQSGGFFNRRSYSCHFIVRRDERKGLSDYNEKIADLRQLYLQFLSRIVTDAAELRDMDVYLQYNDINYVEPGPYGYGGAAGLYFQFSIDEPTDLIYEGSQWN